MDTEAGGRPSSELTPWQPPPGGYGRALMQKAEDELRRDLLPGEQVIIGSRVTSDPPRWSAAVLGLASLVVAFAKLDPPLPQQGFSGPIFQ